MKTKLSKKVVSPGNSADTGKATRKTVRDVSKSDLKPPKGEMTGASDMDPNEVVLESAPESERWDPVPGSTGHKAPVNPSADEDEEGRSENEKLVEEGVEGAELDQMRQARGERKI